MDNLQRAEKGEYFMRIALVLGSDNGVIWGRVELISLNKLISTVWRALDEGSGGHSHSLQ